VVLNGHYGDTLFKGTKLRQPTVDLGSLGSFELPFERSITDLETYVDFRADVQTPSYVRQPESVRETYRSNVRTEGLSVVDHGVSYPSLREAMVAKSVPLTNINSQFFYYGTAQMMPSGTPFLDNRLIDLFLSTPVRFLLRGNLIDAATRRLAPELADIPHGGGVVPINYPFALQRAGELATGFAQRHLLPDPAEPHWTYGPWPDHSELIRSHEFVRETIDDNEELIRSLPFLSWDGANECYEAHLDGEERMGPLYTLVTFLEMPVVDRVLEDREDRLADTVR
jgi:asparagine synthase (glutamine-hydrolysing)